MPRCYNAIDGQNGTAADPGVPGGYYCGPTWYQRTLDAPADWKDRRVSIRFGAVFLVADVYSNGEKLGEHRGGFAAFCYELTDKLKFGAPNERRVRVDNARNPDVAPLSADFTMEGGIYRSVQLIVTGQECITPLDYAGPGVYVTPTNGSADGVDVMIESKLSAFVNERRGLLVQTEILNAENQPVAKLATQSPNNEPVTQRFHIAHPHLWNGIRDPYSYKATVKLTRGGEAIDEVTVPSAFARSPSTTTKAFCSTASRTRSTASTATRKSATRAGLSPTPITTSISSSSAT